MAKKILCVLPNASDNISGIAFEKRPEGMVTVDSLDKIDESIARKFLKIGGYRIIEVKDENTLSVPVSKQVAVEAETSVNEDSARGEVDNALAEVMPAAQATPRRSSRSKKAITNE